MQSYTPTRGHVNYKTADTDRSTRTSTVTFRGKIDPEAAQSINKSAPTFDYFDTENAVSVHAGAETTRDNY